MKKDMLKLLYLSFEQELSPDDQERLENSLSESEVLREEKRRIQKMRNLISNMEIDSFKPFFEERVMKGVLQEKPKVVDLGNLPDSIYTVFRPLSLATSLVVFLILAYHLAFSGTLSLETLLGIPEYTIENIVYAVQ